MARMGEQLATADGAARAASRPRLVLTTIAVVSAVAGVVVWNLGYAVQLGSGSRYPVEVATVAGYFIGLAINIGIPLVAYSLYKEMKLAFFGVAREST